MVDLLWMALILLLALAWFVFLVKVLMPWVGWIIDACLRWTVNTWRAAHGDSRRLPPTHRPWE